MNIDTPYLLAASDSKNFMVRKSLVRLMLVCGKMAAKYLYWNLRGYSKAKVYYFWSNVEFLVRQCFAVRRHVTDNEMKLRDLEGQKFVFLPLATEPETI